MASLLVLAPVPVLSGAGLGVSEAQAQSAGTSGATSHSAALLHRTVLEEGQTRQFQISELPAHRAYYVFFKPLAAPYTAEASDVTFRVPDQRGVLEEVAAGSGSRGWKDWLSGRIDFEVEAHSDVDTDDETFGVRLCTTADCTGGTVLADWTVTVDDASDSTVAGTGVSVTVSGGHTTVMERSLNTDSRDRRDDITITLAAAPSTDIVILGKVDTQVRTGGTDDDPTMEAIARPNGSPASGDITDNPDDWFFVARFDSTVGGQPAAGEHLTRNVELVAEHNVVDSGDLSGTWSFRVVTEADADEGDRDSTDYQDNDAYSAISLPSLPVTVTGDDEPTEVFIESADTKDNIAIEGSTTDTAKFKVRLSRALVAGEWIEVPLAFRGAELGTHFTLELDGNPQGVAYADSSDGTLGLVRFTGPSAAEATVVVTAVPDDGNSVTENMLVHTYRDSQPSQRLRIDTNLDEVCSGEGCGPGRYGERVYRIALQEASDGLRIIDDGDRRLVEASDATSTYEYGVRLNTRPSNNVDVTVTTSDTARTQIASDKTTLTFTPSNWDTAQTMRVFARGNNTDEADQPFTVTHAFSGDATYAALAAATHDLVFVDNDATTVTMSGTGVRTSSSGREISEVMVEGDASRVDRSLTVSLSRALEDGEYVRVPLYLEAVGHSLNPDTTPCDLTNTVDFPDNEDKFPADLVEACNVVDSVRGPRYSANVSWPPHYNDFDMAASGTGVSVEAVNRHTPPHAGFRWLEFRGAGAQSATIELNARDGFDDGESFDEQFSVEFRNHLLVLPIYAWENRRHLNPDTNLSGGIEPAQRGVQAWYGIADDDEGGGSVPEVPAGWPLLPSGLNPGDSFRLLYATSQTTTAQSGDLADYDAFVRAEITGNDLVNGGVAALADHAGHFKAIAETVGTTARDHAQFSPDDGDHPDVPVYWVGGTKVSDDNADFTDGDWDDEVNPRYADGTAATVNASGYWTGSGTTGVGIVRCDEVSNGRRSTSQPRLGEADATVGLLNNSGRDGFPLGPRTGISSQCGRQHGYSHNRAEQRPMYALSGEFTVAGAVGVADATAAEGSPVAFTVSRSEASSSPVTVTYSLTDGRGIAGESAYAVATGASGGTGADYTNDFTGAGTVTIAANATSATISVPTTQDSTYEGDHYFTVTLTDATPGGFDPTKGTATGTITDAADLPTVAFSSAAVSAGEGDGTVDVTVARTGATLVPSSVFWTTADGTGGSGAAHPGDYTAQSGYLEFAANEATKTLTVGLVDDDTAESAETFKVQLDDSQVVAAQVGSTAETTVTVNDDDGGTDGVTLSAFALTLTELGSSSAVEKTYTVVLDTDPGANVTVTVTSGDPTAVAVDTDSDTAGDQSTLTFTPGNAGNWNSAQTVTLRALNDGDAAAETVTVSHAATVSDTANPYHQISIGGVTATTVDAGHKVVVSPTAVSLVEGGEAAYEIRLASDPGGAVTVGITVSDTFLVTTNHSAVDFDSDDWHVPQQVTVASLAGTDSTTITHDVTTATTAYPISLTIDPLSVTVTAPVPVTVSMAGSDGDANGNAVEGASNSTGYRTVTLTLGRALTGSEEVTVPLTVVGATVTDDYTFGLEPAAQSGVSLETSGSHSAQNPAVVFGTGASSATLRLKPVDNSVRSEPYVVVAYGTGARAPSATGATLGTVSGDPVGVVFVDDETGDFEVAADWPLLPSGLSGGDEFRLMFLTSQTRGAGSQVIDVYNEWAQGVVAAGGHSDLKPYGSLVRVVGSTTDVDARVNAGMHTGSAWADGSTSATDSGVAVYWLAAQPSNKVADNYFDFYDGDWDGGADQSGADTVESGAARTAATAFWTGSDNDGTKAGNQFRLGRGMPRTAVVASGNPLSDSTAIRNSSLPMLVMSPVFKVAAAAAVPELTFGSATYSVTEGDHPDTATVTVTVNADSAPTSDLTVSLASANGTAVVREDYTAPASTFTFTSGNSSETIDVSIVSNDFLEGSETFTLTLQDGTGYTVGTPATTTVTITDEDNVGVRLSSATYTVAEGDGTVTVGVRVIGESNIPIRVTLTPSDGTATGGSDPTAAGVDYDSDAIMSITIPALDRSISRTIAINDDNIFEPSETFTVTLTVVAGQRGVTTGIPNVGTITITDNDPAPVTVAMSASDGDSDGNAVEGASNATGYRTITLTLGRALTGTETVTVPLSVVGATVTTDYTFALQPTSQTGVSLTTTGGTHTAQNPAVEFTSGASSATLRLTPVDDNARTQPYVVIDYGTGSRAPVAGGGATLGDLSGAPIGVVLVDDESGDIEVASDWALTPSGLSAGDDFRLLFRTSETRDATASDIGVYDGFVRGVLAEGGHAAIKPYAGLFKVFATTRSGSGSSGTTARVHNDMTSAHTGHSPTWVDASGTDSDAAGTPTYWLNGAILANNYRDLCDQAWSGSGTGVRDGFDTDDPRSEDGTRNVPSGTINDYQPYEPWTGSGNACEAWNFPLGNSTVSRGGADSGGNLWHTASAANSQQRPLYGYSPVFKVAAAATGPVVSVRLMVGEGENRNSDGEVEKPESDATVSFPVSLDAQPAADMTVCVRVAESGDTDRVTMADEGIKTVSFLTGVQTGSIDVAWTDTGDDDLDSVITVTAVPSSTAGCTSTDSYTVSGAHGSEKVRITDDEVTQLSLSSSDPEMGEGDASDTAVLTVSAGRALVAGESVVATITLASGTGVRLPGHGTPDFAVTVTGTGVALTGAASATPRVTFTGADGSTVQTATVTLTPVAAADDGDTADEEVTATLSVVAGTGSGTVVTGGGVEVASASSEVDLSIDDDETSACAAQSTVFSVSDLRVTEMGGVATYCVRLLTAPSGGQTTVTIGEAAGRAVFDPSTFTVIESVSSGAATVSPSSLTFTASNYTEPREVTVTAVDEAGDNRNRRFNLTHTASGGGYSSQALGAVPVLVTDAPELEVFEYRRTYDEAAYNAHKRAHGGWGIFRPNTLTSTPGLGPAPDITPGEVLDYFVRLSSQPAGEVVVTIDVTQIAGYDPTTFTGISFTRGGAPQQSLSFTFHDGDPTAAGCSDGGYGGDRYTQTRISWKCYRVVWVHNTRDGFGEEGTRCANVVHTAVGGGFRAATVDTIRAFSIGSVYGNSPKEYLIGQYRDQDTNAFYRLVYFSKKVPGGPYTWHMRPWSGGPLVTADTLNLEMEWVPSGKLHWPADCPLLRRQYANQHTPQNSPLPAEAPPVPETAVANLTLTANGTGVDVAWDAVADATKYLVAYTAEATDGEAQSAGVFDGVTATGYTFDHGIAGPATVTVTVTPGHDADGGTIAVYLEDLAATATVDTGTTAQTAVPEVSVTAGADVTEGSDATFTLTAAPAPAAPLTVAVDITQTGDHAATTGTHTVTIGTGGTYTLTVATTDDDTDEADGTVTATVNDGAGYTVSTADTASVAVADDDPPPGCVPERTLKLARDYYELNRHRAPGYGKNWRRVLIAFGDITDTQLEAFTAAEARQSETRWAGWRPFREALECIEQAQQDPAPPVEPEISITAGADATEGSDATFTITATPGPAVDLTVTVEITQTGDYATTGTQTVTIPTTGTYTLTVATADDSTDEADGSITATIDTGTGYTVSTTDSDATVNVADDDDPPPPPTPEISITAGNGITEGSDATFTVTASPTPHAALSINVSVSQSGDHGATTGTQTITIPTSGSYTLTVATTDDNTDEADGSVTATVDTGTGYSVSSSSGSATVAVADDDDPPADDPPADDPPADDDSPDPVPSGPQTVSVTDATATEGDTDGLRFVVEVTPAGDQTITLGYGVFDRSAQQGQDFNAPYQEFTLDPGDTRIEIIVAVIDDNETEGDETLTLFLFATSGITIPGYFLYATGTIKDND